MVGILAAIALAFPTSSPAVHECTFERGTTTCVSVEQSAETELRNVFSGCLAGPTGQPGRRVTTWEDTYIVTTTTTTFSHGRNGRTYDTVVEVTRELTTSRTVNSVCEPL